MLKGLFGGRKEERGAQASRPVAQHAWEIGPGGFVKFGLAVRAEGLADADTVVNGVHAVHIGTGHVRRVLEADAGGLGAVTMWKGEAGRLAVARPVLVAAMEEAFGKKQLRKLVEGDGATLAAKRVPKGFDGWLAQTTYRREADHEVYRHECDPAETGIGDTMAGATAFDLYRLVSDERSHAVEIHVHDGGRTEARLVVLLEERHVEEFLPGS